MLAWEGVGYVWGGCGMHLGECVADSSDHWGLLGEGVECFWDAPEHVQP